MVPHPPTAFVAMSLRVISGIGTPPLHSPQQIELNVSTTCVFCSAWFVVQTSARSLTSLGSHPTCSHAKTLAQFRRGSISGSSTLHRCAA